MLDLKIAKPCDQSWTAMKGDERVRHCQRCDHNVYNIAEMSEREVEELIRRTEGKFCARIYRRTDNRVMTRDCPRGVAAVRRRVATGVLAACAAAFYGFSFAKREPRTFAQAREVVRKVPPVKKIVEKIDPPVRMGEPMLGAPPVPSNVDLGRADTGKIRVIPKRP